MVAPRVFIDGHAGTTGLRIREWLEGRADLEVLALDGASRKQSAARKQALQRADLVVLCLPDAAARETMRWIENPDTRVIDSSTAHRAADGWVYGLPELGSAQRAAIASARRVANPGCYATPVVLGLRPLVAAGLLPPDAPVTVHALSGYSGGGRAMIERWEDPASGLLSRVYEAPYALDHVHKHLPEMVRYGGLGQPLQFIPAVGPFRCGMRVEIPLPAAVLARGATCKAIWEALDARYADEPFVSVAPLVEPIDADESSFDPRTCNDTNRLDLAVVPHPDGHVLLVARLDNLGKGAAGAAIQNLNLMLGLAEGAGLRAS